MAYSAAEAVPEALTVVAVPITRAPASTTAPCAPGPRVETDDWSRITDADGFRASTPWAPAPSVETTLRVAVTVAPGPGSGAVLRVTHTARRPTAPSPRVDTVARSSVMVEGAL